MKAIPTRGIDPFRYLLDPFQPRDLLSLLFSNIIPLMLTMFCLIQGFYYQQGLIERSATWVPAWTYFLLMLYCHVTARWQQGLGVAWRGVILWYIIHWAVAGIGIGIITYLTGDYTVLELKL